MATSFTPTKLLLVLVLISSICYSEQQQSPESQALLKIQALLDYPAVLSNWSNKTKFCNIEPTASVTVVCYEQTITQLHIIGQNGVSPLPRNFSIVSFLDTLACLRSLKVLTLVSLGLRGQLPGNVANLSSVEIFNISSNFIRGVIPKEVASLKNLQTLVLDDNMFRERIPDELGLLSLLAVLSMRKNLLNGSLPDSLGKLKNLRVLDVSHNKFIGEVPDLRNLSNLQVLDMEYNSLGPQFPRIDSNKLVSLVLRKNKFSCGIPDKLSSLIQLQWLDLSFNRFVGPFQASLFALPSITYLNIEGNKLTGMLLETMACSAGLEFVDLSGNLLTGSLPRCLLSDHERRVVVYAKNCLDSEDTRQRPISFCRNGALAVGIVPHHQQRKQTTKALLALSISAGTIGGIVLVALVVLAVRKVGAKNIFRSPSTGLIKARALKGHTSKFLTDAGYVTQSMKQGALGVSSYRTFSLKELEDATNNFNTSTFMADGSYGQMYRGTMPDGSHIAIRCLKMKRSHSTQSFVHHIDLISKLRNQNLVSTLGHCFECYLDDSSVSRIFLVFEYVPNGTLRDWISDRRGRQKLTWSQRIAAAIGVAKGIQFLHAGIVPGIFSNNLKITDILLDQNLVAKLCSYNLPFLAENMEKVDNEIPLGESREVRAGRIQYEEKSDIYDLGVILQEVIVGRQLNTQNEVEIVKHHLQVSLTSDTAARKSMVDPSVRYACSDESLKTMMEVCSKCLLKNPADRPSIEDVLWNLKFAAQVHDSMQSSDASPVLSPFQRPRLQLIVQ